MNKNKFYLFSGKLKENSELLSINNRAFKYSDGLFETMFFTRGKIHNLERHVKRLQLGISILKMAPSFDLNEGIITKDVEKLLAANKIKNAARIRIQIFRKDGGLYLPENNDIDYIIEAKELHNDNFTLNEKGLNLGISKSITRHNSILTSIKTISKQEAVLCALEAKENNWDDAIILNSENQIAETSNSNIFIVKNNTIITPRIEDGALNGTMRQWIIDIAKKHQIIFLENAISIQDIECANEVFITNAITGIRWVYQIENNLYSNNTSKFLIKELNKTL